MSFWCLQFLPKNERKQVNQRYHSSKVEFVCSFFERNVGLKKIIWTLSDLYTPLISTRFLIKLLTDSKLKNCHLLVLFAKYPIWESQNILKPWQNKKGRKFVWDAPKIVSFSQKRHHYTILSAFRSFFGRSYVSTILFWDQLTFNKK